MHFTKHTVQHLPVLILNLNDFSEFISPASARASFKRIQGQKYKQRKNTQNERDDRRTKQKDELEEDELAVGRVFA